MAQYHLHFESRLNTDKETVWQWITSVAGIGKEMFPLMKMTVPKGVTDITSVKVAPGEKLFHSRILLFGFLPFDYSDLTIIEIKPGTGFIEESPMGSMKRWRHERFLRDAGDGSVMITDELFFTPKFGGLLTKAIIESFFNHRHKVLRRNFA